MANPFVHLELNTQDVAKAKAFYGALFQWKLDDVPMADGTSYTMINAGGAPGGGIMKHPMEGTGSMWLPYVLVDDIEASTRQATRLGAKLVKDVTEIPDMGWLSIFIDPTGGVLGLWKAKQ